MSATKHTLNSRILEHIFAALNITQPEMKKIIRDFHSEMAKGLSGKKSSLKMLPAYLDVVSREEKGRFIGLDLGGTNLRLLEVELKGRGIIVVIREKKFVLPDKYLSASALRLFDFIASCLKNFSLVREEKLGLGFTFSFPMQQAGIARGFLLHWTKDFSARGAVGKDVVALLAAACLRKGLCNIKISALLNDAVATLLTRSYQDSCCDIGIILGTGTNACYREKISEITKDKDLSAQNTRMIINIEWGNFNKLRLLAYDRQLDAASDNQRQQILEKMVSGKYLGEITRLILMDLIKRKLLFAGCNRLALGRKDIFKSEYMSRIENDRSKNLSASLKLLRGIKISNSSLKDRILVRKICQRVAKRAARLSAAALAAVVTKIDPSLARRHSVAIDGAVYEKHPGFRQNIKSALKELFANKAARIKIVLTKDGSAKGAAIAAAVAANSSGGFVA